MAKPGRGHRNAVRDRDAHLLPPRPAPRLIHRTAVEPSSGAACTADSPEIRSTSSPEVGPARRDNEDREGMRAVWVWMYVAIVVTLLVASAARIALQLRGGLDLDPLPLVGGGLGLLGLIALVPISEQHRQAHRLR